MLFRESGDLPDSNEYHGVQVMKYAHFPFSLNSIFSSVTKLSISIILLVVQPVFALAEEPTKEDWNAKFQSTYIWQIQPGFKAAYSGVNSLSPDAETSWTFTTTAYLGWHPWKNGELYFNPELVESEPLSGSLVGLGGFQNAELQRGAKTSPTLYYARLFLRQTWGLGGETEIVESDMNQLAGMVEKNRFVLTVGKMSVLDIFDHNSYSSDPRTQFMNWSSISYTAYDYAADARGYTLGVAGEWYHENWVLRLGHMALPKIPNGEELDGQIFERFGDQMEVERVHELFGLPGKIRVLGYLDRAVMASYRDAINYGIATGTTPNILNVRTGVKTKYGFGVGGEQSLNSFLDIFFRAMWSDGQIETEAFTEADRSLSAGVSIKGDGWGRTKDTIGVSLTGNWISNDRRDYLQYGGISNFIGDGGLNYGRETILEAYYSLNLVRKLWFTADYQHIINPGYNADRGPVDVFGTRLHVEY